MLQFGILYKHVAPGKVFALVDEDAIVPNEVCSDSGVDQRRGNRVSHGFHVR